MEKIALKNMEIEILNGATENAITVPFKKENDVTEIVSFFATENLNEFKILNSSNVECTTIFNKKVTSYTTNLESKTITFNLEDIRNEIVTGMTVEDVPEKWKNEVN